MEKTWLHKDEDEFPQSLFKGFQEQMTKFDKEEIDANKPTIEANKPEVFDSNQAGKPYKVVLVLKIQNLLYLNFIKKVKLIN